MTSTSRVFLAACALMAIAGCNPPPPDTDAGESDTPTIACTSDASCDDGVFCNGEESCAGGSCTAGTPPACDDGLECTVSRCAEDRRACVHLVPDVDGDGFGLLGCGDGTDCDDGDGDVFPGAQEVCDAIDDDCDPSTLGGNDFDGDGLIGTSCCNPDASGTAVCGTDCDDAAATSQPGALEVCDRRDQDCDGVADDGVDVELYADADHDGVGAGEPMRACAGAAGFSRRGDDCDDANGDRYPDAPELCDELDNDCDLDVDEDTRAVRWYADTDRDGFGAAGEAVTSCIPVANRSTRATDCDDGNSAIHPAASEACNGIDDDCNGLYDFEVGVNDWEDDDRDGVVDAACLPSGGDCDDTNPLVGGGSSELCDGADNDCDGTVDEDVTSTPYYRDVDGDGYGSESSGAVNACSAPAGFSSRGGDCSDHTPSRYPGASELCDAADDDCDAAVDEGCSSSCPGPGEVLCGGSCIDARTDERFCGAEAVCAGTGRGTACEGGELCSGGECVSAFLVPNGERIDWGPRETIDFSFAVPSLSAMVPIRYTLDGSTPGLSPTTRLHFGTGTTIELADGQTIRWVAAAAGGFDLGEQRYTHRFDPTAASRPGLLPENVQLFSGPPGRASTSGAAVLAPLHVPTALSASVTAWPGASTGPLQLVVTIDGGGPVWCGEVSAPTTTLGIDVALPDLPPGLHAIRMELTHASACAVRILDHPVNGDGLLVAALAVSPRDCAGTIGGAAVLDNCAVCDANAGNDCTQDCEGTWGGTATRDACGSCDTNPLNDCVTDCNGVEGGSAALDLCGRCAGGTTSVTPCPTVRLEPVADTTLVAAAPTTNFGSSTTLTIQPFEYGSEERMLLRFDLSGIPSTEVVMGARLEMVAYTGFAYGSDGNVYSHLVPDDTWGETEVSWDTQPVVSGIALGFWWLWYDGRTADQLGSFSTVELAAAVRSEHEGDGRISFRMSSPGYQTYYRSREYAAAAQRPALIVGTLPR